MQVAMVTSNRVACGVRDYSERLALELRRGEVSAETFPVQGPMEGLNEADLLHLQYQDSLYPGDLLGQWIALADLRPVLVTLHDHCIPPTFPWLAFEKVICHTEEIAAQAQGDKIVLPLGIPLRPMEVVSFGLGRTLQEEVEEVCEAIGAGYHYLDGSKQWLCPSDLEAAISEADAVVLWYPDEPLAGSSFAARVALGCRRPLITNCTKWFQDLDYLQHTRVSDLDGLEQALLDIRNESESGLEGRTLEDVAAVHRSLYRKALGG